MEEQEGKTWKGTASDLYSRLEEIVGEATTKGKEWPANAQALSRRKNSLASTIACSAPCPGSVMPSPARTVANTLGTGSVCVVAIDGGILQSGLVPFEKFHFILNLTNRDECARLC